MKSMYLLGDSISIDYGPHLEKMLEGKYLYSRKDGTEKALENLDVPAGANGGDSSMVLKFLRNLINKGWSTDLLLINCGLHDIKKDVNTGQLQISPEDYANNLQEIFRLLAENNINTVWIRNTPVITEIHNSISTAFHRFSNDLVHYNEVADKAAVTGGTLSIIDLYGFTQNLGGSEIFRDHVHYTSEVSRLQAAYIAGAVDALLDGSPE